MRGKNVSNFFEENRNLFGNNLNLFIEDEFLVDYDIKEELTLTVKVDNELYYENEFGIYLGLVEIAKKDGKLVSSEKKLIKLKGRFHNPLNVGHTYYVKGAVDVYREEKQLYVTQSFGCRPVTDAGMISYLKTLRGLNKRAEDIFDVFGMDSIDALLTKPKEVVKKVFGVGIKTVEKCKQQLLDFEENQITIINLLELGLNEEEATSLVKIYGTPVLDKIHENPYFLIDTPVQVSFKKADKIAFDLGFDMLSEERLQRGVLEALKELSYLGHTCYPYKEIDNELILNTSGFIYFASDFLSIPLNFKTMVKIYENNETIYKVKEREYNIDLSKMRTCIVNYNSLKYQKENALYKVVDIDFFNIHLIVESMIENKTLVLNSNNYISHYKFYNYERVISEKIINKPKGIKTGFDIKEILNTYLYENNIELEDAQMQAVYDICENKGGFHVLDGSAGCGKTFVLKIVLNILSKIYGTNKKPYEYKVFAPTGNAAKIASVAIEKECFTIHRGLGYVMGDFSYNESNPLECDCLVIDETSMLDVELGYSLLNAVHMDTKLVFVGDVKQLPSVGPGSVLKDIIESGKVNVNTLSVPKRQREDHGIYKNANNVIEKNMVETAKTNDFYVLNRSSDESILKGLIESVQKLLNKGNSLKEIQVLTPQRTTMLGIHFLNYTLQQIFNPLKDNCIQVFKTSFELNSNKYKIHFRPGDKIMHIKNNYDKDWYVKNSYNQLETNSKQGVFNGEMGIIETIEEKERIIDGKLKIVTTIIAQYDDGYIIYEDDFNEIELAYALTIHKSQGAGWKNIIIPITPRHSFMWDNNLLYTAITRAREMVVILCDKGTLYQAILSDKSKKRYTNLPTLL